MIQDAITMPAIAVDSERDCLGACIISRDAVRQIQSILHSRDFYRKEHRQLFELLCRMDHDMNGNGEEFDIRSIAEECQKEGFLTLLGGPEYLWKLYEDIPTAVNVSYHANAIHEKALIRNHEIFGHDLQQAAQRNDVTPAMLRQMTQDYLAKLEEKPRPAWAFWKETNKKDKTVIEIDSLQFLNFLSDKMGYRAFTRRGKIVIVTETVDGFDYCLQRGQQVVSLKSEVIAYLKEWGFGNVASELLNKPRLFHIDVLENLPEISKERIQNSIFCETKTEIYLTDEVTNEQPFLVYVRDDGTEHELVSRHDVGVIIARQGQGKTKSLEALVSEALKPGCEPECPFKFYLEPDEIIVFFATEGKDDDHKRMTRRIAARTHPRINNMLNEDGNFRQLRVFTCASSQDKSLFIMECLERIEEKIGLIVLDTLIGTVPNMNDEEAANIFFSELLNALKVKNAAMLCTIHAASNSKDEESKGMGHLGSLFMRQATLLLQITRPKDNPDVYVLASGFRNAKSRNSKDRGIFSAMAWEYEGLEPDGMNHFINYIPKDADDLPKKTPVIEKNMKLILKTGGLCKTDLTKRYTKYTGCTEKTARSHIKIAQESGIVANISGKLCLNNE